VIVGICGEAGSGKGTTADVLIERGYTRGKFANALKEMFRALLRYQGLSENSIEAYVEGNLKELPSHYLAGKSPREFMQGIGQWGREFGGEDFWVDIEFEVHDDDPKLLFDDLRHDNEEAAIVKRGGVVLQIVGRGGINSDHVSEQFKPKNPAAVIDNSGTIEELRDKVDEFARDLSWAA
jgi:hypothetical protein